MVDNIQLQIEPRFVKEEDGFRPFQKETLNAIKNSSAEIILVEAPVGSGKSYIIRNLIMDEYFKRKPIVLTYPTKILMDSQVGAMKKESSKEIEMVVWPDDDRFVKNGINIFNYSSSSLIKYLQQKSKEFEYLDKGKLLGEIFAQLGFYSPKEAIVTSPDVLWLLVDKKVYKGSKKLQNFLQGSFIFFDEFHLYSNLANFPKLVDDLLDMIATKIILLSATPYHSEELKQIIDKYSHEYISFQGSVAKSIEEGRLFNFPLNVEIHQFRYTNRQMTLQKLKELIPKIEKPAAVIFDSIFRLQHLKRKIVELFGHEYKFVEWHGMEKSESVVLDDKTIVLGTSSIEVGIDMNFKSLITEASYWTSAIQRIGRVGRKSKGNLFIFTNRDFRPYITDAAVSRDWFENEIIKKSLKDPIGRLISGEMFRGDSYNFVVKDLETRKVVTYSESIFAMYDIEDYEDEWRILDIGEKKEILNDWEINKRDIEMILLKDTIFPFWGALTGKLKDEYCEVKIKYNREDKILDVIADERYTFYGA